MGTWGEPSPNNGSGLRKDELRGPELKGQCARDKGSQERNHGKLKPNSPGKIGFPKLRGLENP